MKAFLLLLLLLIGYQTSFSQSIPSEYRGLLTSKKINTRMLLSVNQGKIMGMMQYEREMDTILLKGNLDTINHTAEIQILNKQGKKSGAYIKGTLDNSKLKGTYCYLDERTDCELLSVNPNTAPKFRTLKSGQNPKLRKLMEGFTDIKTPTEFKFRNDVQAIPDYSEFMNRPIDRLGGMRFTLKERAIVIRAVHYWGKTEVPVEIYNDSTGIVSDTLTNTILVIQVYCSSKLDGDLYGCYAFVYNHKDEFTNAFVLFEGQRRDQPYVTSKLSSSLIFQVQDVDNDAYNVRINEDGNLRYLDR